MNAPDNKNSTDFEIYQSPEEKLLETYQAFAAEFASQIVAQDLNSAHQFLAPWLQKEISPDELKAAFEKELWRMNGYWDIEELIYPAGFSIGYNTCSLASLKEDEDWREPRKFSTELTDENFRKWMVLQFLPAEDDPRTEMDGWFDFWFVVAEVNSELKIGFFEFEDVD
jgi:hypothetical protein